MANGTANGSANGANKRGRGPGRPKKDGGGPDAQQQPSAGIAPGVGGVSNVAESSAAEGTASGPNAGTASSASAGSQSNDAPALGGSVTVTAPKPPRGQSASAINRRKQREAKAAAEAAGTGPSAETVDAESVKQSANVLMVLAEQLAITLAGDGAAMTDAERTMIGDALPSVLEKMTPAAAAQVTSFINPAMLLLGVGIWGARVAALAGDRAKAARAQRQTSRPAPAPNLQPQTGPDMSKVEIDAEAYRNLDNGAEQPRELSDAAGALPAGKRDARAWLQQQQGGVIP